MILGKRLHRSGDCTTVFIEGKAKEGDTLLMHAGASGLASVVIPMAMIALWASAVYLVRNRKLHWIASIPAAFMTTVCVTYIIQAPEGLGLNTSISYPIGKAAALVSKLQLVM